MKVTVSFGDTKVVVPCGDGSMAVRDLVDCAMHRYRKSTSAAVAAGLVSGPGPGLDLPSVEYVKLARDNGILDWDDRVCDVLDDREMVVACLSPVDHNSLPPPPGLPDPAARVPPLHGDDSVGSASSPEFHTAPASAALSAVTARVRQGCGEGSGGATGSLTTLGDTCSPGGSTSGASSAAGPDGQAAPGHPHPHPHAHPHPHGHGPHAPGVGVGVGVGVQHNLGCPAAAGGSEPALGPPAGLSRIVCCRRPFAGSSIHVSGSGHAPAPVSGSPPAASRAVANNGLLAHRHQRHRGSLDSCAIPASGGAPASGPGVGVAEPGQPGVASSGDHLHHRHQQHPFLPPPPPTSATSAGLGKPRADKLGDSSAPLPGRSPVMVAIDSNSSSDHDEDYPRLRREPLGRQSLGNDPSLLRWLEAQSDWQGPGDDRSPSQPNSAPTQPLSLRIEPRGDAGAVEPAPGGSLLKTAHPPGSAAALKEAEAMGGVVYRSTILLRLRNEENEQGGGLGIQVKPYYSPGPGLSNRVEAGLEIQRVVPGGRMAREGKLRAGDRIIEINDVSLSNVSFVRAQEMFREAMRTSQIALRVIPAEPVQSPPGNKSAPPPLLPKPRVSSPPLAPALNNSRDNKRPAPAPPGGVTPDDEEDGWGEDALDAHVHQQQQLAAAAAAVANAKKAPPPPQRSPLTHLSGNNAARNGSRERDVGRKDDDDDLTPRPNEDGHQAASSSSPSSSGHGARPGGHVRSGSLGGSKKDLVNTKRPGVQHTIVLAKGRDGFGFSLTTRDTKTNGPNPILVKSILSRGSAIRDGRLRCGDRVLEVDGLDVTERSQKEVVQMLKGVAVGQSVRLVISRQVEDEPGPGNGQAEEDRAGGQGAADGAPAYRLVTLTFDISLEDTELNGLGISVKGLSRESPGRGDERDFEGKDEGVYVKNVIPKGAASNDGRLEVNDQILEINGTSLRGLSNKQALSRLRSAVQRGSKDSLPGGCIRVVVARRQPVGREAQPASSVNSADSSNHSMLISAEVHDQQQQRASKQRLARQPTRQARVEDEEGEDDDTPPLPPPPPVDDLDSVCGTLPGGSTLEHPLPPPPPPHPPPSQF